jgi:hypothetical protein
MKYHSNHMRSLADRFYDLVCSKLNQYHTNVQKRKRKTNPLLDAEDLSNIEEAESLEHKVHTDVSVRQNVTDDKHNNFVHHSTFGTINKPSEDSIPLSIDRGSAQPTTAPPHPPAPALHDYNPMGDTPSKLVEADPKFQHPKLDKFMEQQGKTNRANSHRLDYTFPDFEVTPAGVRMISPSTHGVSQLPPRYMGPNERPLDHTTHNVKRPLNDGTRGRKTKRNKNHPDVQIAKPSLVVVLKLTQGKGVSDRPKTVPPQQPPALIPSVEADEIAVRHSSVLASRHDVVASDFDIGDERRSIQPLSPDQDPIENANEAAVDTAHNLSDTTSAHDEIGPTDHADDAIEQSSSTPHQSRVAQQQQDSQVMAEFRKFWFGEAFEVVSGIITTSFNNPTPEELVAHILVPILKHVGDQSPSKTAQRDPLSIVKDARGQFTPQGFNPCRRESASLEQSISTLETVHHGEVAEGSVPALNTEKSHVSPGETVNRADDAGEHMNQGYVDPFAAAKTPGKKRAIVGDDMITDQLLDKVSSDNSSSMHTPGASNIAGDSSSIDSGYAHSQLVQHINLTMLLDRRDGSDPKYVCTIGIRNIRNNSDLFNAIQKRSWWRLEPDEEVFRAIITEAGESATESPRIELGLSKGDTEDRSWDMLLLSLRKLHEREKVDIRMNLVAKLFVMGRSDWKT